jgi:hypothetical protein
MDSKINEIYVEFITVLTNNKVEYSGANLGQWKMITIQPSKDSNGKIAEIDFTNDGIAIKYSETHKIMS